MIWVMVWLISRYHEGKEVHVTRHNDWNMVDATNHHAKQSYIAVPAPGTPKFTFVLLDWILPLCRLLRDDDENLNTYFLDAELSKRARDEREENEDLLIEPTWDAETANGAITWKDCGMY